MATLLSLGGTYSVIPGSAYAEVSCRSQGFFPQWSVTYVAPDDLMKEFIGMCVCERGGSVLCICSESCVCMASIQEAKAEGMTVFESMSG